MVVLFLALLLPADAPAQVRAVTPVRTATPHEKKRILGEIALGLKAEAKMKESYADARAARMKGNMNAFETLMARTVEQEAAMHAHLNRAILLTGESYNIGPESGDSGVRITDGPLKGNSPKYSPVFAPDTMRSTREVVASEGSKNRYLRFAPDKDQAGGTWEDGMVMVRLQAFRLVMKDGNPGKLASLLHHEAVHFNDLVTTGWHTTEENERHAYEEELKTAAVFELNTKQTGFIKSKISEHARRIWLNEHIPYGPSLHRPFPNAAQEEQNRRDYELEQAHKSDFEIDKEKLIEIQKTREASRKAATPIAPIELKPTQTPFFHVLTQYKSYAVDACNSPGQIRSDSILIRGYDLSNPEYDDKIIELIKDDMSDCSRQLLDYLVAAKRRHDYDAMDPTAIRERVSAFTTPPPSPPVAANPAQETVKNLRRMAILACESPEKLTDAEASRAIRTPYLPNAGSAGADLQGCARFVYDALVRLAADGGANLTTDWLRGQAQVYRARSEPPPLGAIPVAALPMMTEAVRADIADPSNTDPTFLGQARALTGSALTPILIAQTWVGSVRGCSGASHW